MNRSFLFAVEGVLYVPVFIPPADSDGAEDVDTTYPYISPLSIAVHAGHIETVEVLRRNGCDATRVDESTISPYERGLLRLAVAHAHRRNLKKTFFAHNGLVLLDETTKVSSAPVSPSNVASTATDAKPHTQKGDQMWKHVRKSFVGKAGPPDKPPEFRAQKSENSDAKPGIAPKTGLLRNLVGAGRRASSTYHHHVLKRQANQICVVLLLLVQFG